MADNKILPGDDRWTEIEHLPEWDEEFYDVYTAKKLGKWVMLKTLKDAYKNDPRFRSMIEKEFDVRYNLAHPGIVPIFSIYSRAIAVSCASVRTSSG